MQIKTFLFEFIDHDKKKCNEIMITIHSGKNVEWVHSENDLNGYIEWLTQCAKKDFIIKQEIDRFIKDRYFTQNSTEIFKFDDYVVNKQRSESKNVMVNMNTNKNKNIVLYRPTMEMEKNMYKFTKGTIPENWVDMYNYDKIHHHHSLHLIGNEMDENLKLREVSNFDVPLEELESYGSEKFNKNNNAVRNKNTKTTLTNDNTAAVQNTNMNSINDMQTNLTNVLRNQNTISQNYPPLEQRGRPPIEQKGGLRKNKNLKRDFY